MRKKYSTWVCGLILTVINTEAFAEKIPFKQVITPQTSWLVYFIAVFGLFALAIMLTKRANQSLLKQSMIHFIDKKRLGAKTTLYIVEFQKQQFLIAENQQALALHALTNGN